MNSLHSLKRWNRGFEFHLTHGCVGVRLFCLCCPVAALRRADPLSKDLYRLFKKDYETEEETRTQQRAVEPLMNE
jgi:hypothetical protein